VEWFSHFAGLSRGEVRSRAEQYSDPIREYDPDMLEEITGVAEGAGCDVRDVLAINCRSELLFGSGSAAECTSFGLQPEMTGNGHTYVGQNWDWGTDVRDTLILLVIKQEPRPTVVLLDEAGLIGRMGMNSAGMALSTNTLIAEGSRIGVPYNALLRGVLNANSMAEAIGALVRPQRALGANFLLGDGRGQVLDIEATAENVDYLAPDQGIVTHANHFAGARHRGRDMGLERFPDSLYRECRLRDALTPHAPDLREERMKEALRDAHGHPNAICRSVDPSTRRSTGMRNVFETSVKRTATSPGSGTGVTGVARSSADATGAVVTDPKYQWVWLVPGFAAFLAAVDPARSTGAR
jgi:isopenicillin-N N-acyltransferase-like protein